MLVERQSLLQLASLHHYKGEAVRERVSFAGTVLKPAPPIPEQFFGDVDYLNPRALEKPLSNVDGLSVMVSAVEERHDFIENIGRRHDRRDLGQ